jgi:hypothetical protein
LKSYPYEITRKLFFWIAALPFVWINSSTPSEAQAFEATAYQFFEDAEPLFRMSIEQSNSLGRVNK